MTALLEDLRGAIFDLGNVLIQLRPLPFLRLGGSDGSRPQAAGGDPLARLRAHPALDRLERGKATEAEFFDAVRRTLAVEVPDAGIREAYDSILGEPVPGMAELVADMKARGVRVVGLSDISPGHLEAVRRYPAVSLLDGLIASCRTGHKKPEPEAYRAALAALGTRPEETLFVDDRPENVLGAAALGLRAVVFTTPQALWEALDRVHEPNLNSR